MMHRVALIITVEADDQDEAIELAIERAQGGDYDIEVQTA